MICFSNTNSITLITLTYKNIFRSTICRFGACRFKNFVSNIPEGGVMREFFNFLLYMAASLLILFTLRFFTETIPNLYKQYKQKKMLEKQAAIAAASRRARKAQVDRFIADR